MMPVQVPTTASAGNQNSAHMHATCVSATAMARASAWHTASGGNEDSTPQFRSTFLCLAAKASRVRTCTTRVTNAHKHRHLCPCCCTCIRQTCTDCDTGTAEHDSIHGAAQQRGRACRTLPRRPVLPRQTSMTSMTRKHMMKGAASYHSRHQ